MKVTVVSGGPLRSSRISVYKESLFLMGCNLSKVDVYPHFASFFIDFGTKCDYATGCQNTFEMYMHHTNSSLSEYPWHGNMLVVTHRPVILDENDWVCFNIACLNMVSVRRLASFLI